MTVCDSVTPPPRVRAQSHTQIHTHAHTEQQRKDAPPVIPSPNEIVKRAASKGYHWDNGEAVAFLNYNLDRKRTDGWDYAIERWEEQRGKRASSPQKPSVRDPLEADYLSLVNRF